MGERLGGERASKMIPSIIGEGLTITGNVASKGEIQVDGEIQGDIHCGSLLLGDTAQVVGGVIAEDIVVRGRVVGSIRACALRSRRVPYRRRHHPSKPRHRAGCIFRRKVAPHRQSAGGGQGFFGWQPSSHSQAVGPQFETSRRGSAPRAANQTQPTTQAPSLRETKGVELPPSICQTLRHLVHSGCEG